MNTHPHAHPALEIAARLDSILAAINDFLWARLRAVYAGILQNRIIRARRRLLTVLTLLAAGRAPRVHAPRPPLPGTGRQGTAPTPMPRRRAWLRHVLRHDPFIHNLNLRARQLETLLHEPATLALLATAPVATVKSLARTLRPLCRMFAIPLPDALRPPEPTPRPRLAHAVTAPPTAAPDRSLPRYVILAARAWKKKYG